MLTVANDFYHSSEDYVNFIFTGIFTAQRMSTKNDGQNSGT